MNACMLPSIPLCMRLSMYASIHVLLRAFVNPFPLAWMISFNCKRPVNPIYLPRSAEAIVNGLPA